MTKVYNKKYHTLLRKELRNNMPKAEIILWSRLKGRQLNGLKFRRQFGFGKYVADFYCQEKRLVIEVDGPIHEERIEEDKHRDGYIKSLGINIIRFNNSDVYNNLDLVLGKILNQC